MIIKGEVASDEVAKKMIELATCGSGLLSMQPKMDLGAYLNISRQIHSELEQFGKRWFSRIDKLTYKEILGLIEAEIDKYPYIKAYNCIQRCKNMTEVSKAMFGKVDTGANSTWSEKISVIHQFMMINRYIDKEVEVS